MLFYEALEEALVRVLDGATGIKCPLGIRHEGRLPGDYFVYGYVGDAQKVMDLMGEKLEKEKAAIEKFYRGIWDFTQKYPEGENIEDPRGFYHPMQSPGYIGIRVEPNVRLLQSILIKKLRPVLDRMNIAIVVSLTLIMLLDTVYHEYFHYFCDILRKTHDGVLPYSLHEEALATAFSYRMLFWRDADVPSIGPGWGHNYFWYENLLYVTNKPSHNLHVESSILTENGKVSIDTGRFFNFTQSNGLEACLFGNLPNGYNQYADYNGCEEFYNGIDCYLFNKKLGVNAASYDGRILIEAQLSTLLSHRIDIKVI